MNCFLNTRALVAAGFVVGVLSGSVVCAQTQTEQSAKTEPDTPSQSAGQSTPSAATETSTKTEQSDRSEPAKTDTTENPPAAQHETIGAFVAKLDSATRAIHQNGKKDPALVREGCRELLNEVVDLNAMAKSVNAELWEKMTPPQRDAFRVAFEQRLVGNCVRQFGTYEGEAMHLAGVRQTDGGDLLATIRVGATDEGKLVTWRLQTSGPRNWRAVDVITEGRSVVLDAHNEFAAVLQSVNGDIEALIAFMQK